MCLKVELELGSRRSKDGKNSGSDEPRFMSSTTLNRKPESKSRRKGKVIMISYPMYDFSLRESNKHMSSHFFESMSCSSKGGYQEVVRMHDLFENMCCVHRERTVALLAKMSH